MTKIKKIQQESNKKSEETKVEENVEYKQKDNTKNTQEKVVETPKQTEKNKTTQTPEKNTTPQKNIQKVDEVKESVQENNNDNKVEETPKCTNTKHGVGVGNSNLWFNSYEEAVSYYDNLINSYSDQVHNGEITSEEYYKLCPYGYEVWSCQYCGKWTLNYYKR